MPAVSYVQCVLLVMREPVASPATLAAIAADQRLQALHWHAVPARLDRRPLALPLLLKQLVQVSCTVL
jgi:hypothetical protein